MLPDDPALHPHADIADIAVIGAGAAGLMTAIWAARSSGGARVVALDGASHLGAKILVAGGGRCNVTHHHVDETAFSGSSPHAIKKVIRSFDAARTVAFFRDLGVELKREDTGKLFPTTDRARTVLNALLNACTNAGAEILNPRRVDSVERLPSCSPPAPSGGGGRVFEDGGGKSDPNEHDIPSPPRFLLSGPWGSLTCSNLVLATGGMALPKSGSDGAGYAFARALGHTTSPHIFPALVPLIVEPPHFIRDLSGIALPATIEIRAASGKKLIAFTNSTLLTHFGLSGPSVLDASRHLTAARITDPGAHLVINFLPDENFESVDRRLTALGPRPVLSLLRARFPERFAEAILAYAGITPDTTGAKLTKDARRTLVRSLVEHRPPVTGDRGYTHAEVTAGGVPLSEIHVDTMESRVCPHLFLCGEILDVDGRIGGFNFQWAWATGYLAGLGTAAALTRHNPT